jgi:tetratricopeptide (TPR) repeat protein
MTRERRNLVAELKRRRVPQTAALYVAVAWGGTEILVFLIESLFGESQAKEARRYLAVFLIAGFPAAMYLAWVRDLGLKARRLFVAGTLAAGLVGFLLWYVEPPAPPLGLNSIAVLPFKVCEGRQSDSNFAQGLWATVNSKLAARREVFSTMGRQSVQTVMETSPTLAKAGEMLGVNYILTGIVCREGRDPTIEAELTDNRGKIVWRQEFRETTNDYNQVEEQLADLVDNRVAAQFGDRTAGVKGHVVDQDALTHLRIGQGYLEQKDLERAEEEIRKALEIDPDYPEALYNLQIVVSNNWAANKRGENVRETRAILELALDSARAQARRDPGDFYANKIAGFVIHNFAEDEKEIAYMEYEQLGPEGVLARQKQALAGFEEAQLYFDRALALRPDDAEVCAWTAHNLAFLGAKERKEAMAILEQCHRRDPLHAELAKWLAVKRAQFGDVRGAMELLDSFGQLPQGKDNSLFFWQLEILNNLGQVDEQLAYEVETFQDGLQMGKKLDLALTHLARANGWFAYLGLRDEAAALHDAISRLPGEEDWRKEHTMWRLFREDFYLHSIGRGLEVSLRKLEEVAGQSNEEILENWWVKAGQYASAFREAGDFERAVGLYKALALFMQQESWSERAMDLRMALANLYYQLSRRDDMFPVVDFVVDYFEKEVAAGVRHPHVLAQLAYAYGLKGEDEAFLKTLDLAVDYGHWEMGICCQDYWSEEQSRAFARDIPDWLDAFEGNPDYEIIKTRMRSIVDAQRANIRALLAANDMEQLFASSVLPYYAELEQQEESGN